MRGLAGTGTVAVYPYPGYVSEAVGAAFIPASMGGEFIGVRWDSGDVGSSAPKDLKLLNPTPPVAVKATDVSFNEGVIRLAAVHDRKVRFRYSKTPSGFIETREFVPEQIKETRAGHTVFVGPDDDRHGEYRSYRLDRIVGEVTIP